MTKIPKITPEYVYNRLAGFFFSTCALIFAVLSFINIERNPNYVYAFFSAFLIGTVGYSLILGDFIGYYLLHASEKVRQSYLNHKKAYEYGVVTIGAIFCSIALYFMMGDTVIPTLIGGFFILGISLVFDRVKKRNSKD